VPRDIGEVFVVRQDESDPKEAAVYRPALLGIARMHFVDSKARVDCWNEVAALARVGNDEGDEPWEAAATSPGELQTADKPQADVGFAPLPPELAQEKNYAAWAKSLNGHLYRNHTLGLWRAPALKEYSEPSESEADFRVRIVQQARERRDEAVEKLRGKYGSKGAALDERIQHARERVAREKSDLQTQTVETAVSWGTSILRAFLGRKLASVTNVRRAETAARRTSRAARQRGDVQAAEKQLEVQLEKRARLEDEFEEQLAQLKADHPDPVIEAYPVRPRKRDITVEKVLLAWVR
jgi:hypothetical protein